MKVMLISSLPKEGAYATADWNPTPDSAGEFPPIGLSYIAGYLIDRTHHEVVVLDAVSEHLDYPQIEARLLAFRPDIVGTTIFTPTFYGNLVLAKSVKRVLPKCYVCMGGVQHVRMFLEETLNHPEIDLLVRGEGETIFANLLDALENDRPLDTVDGISFKRNGKTISPGREGYVDDINSLPSPAFNLLPFKLYKNRVGTGKQIGVVLTSRGCPYVCTFCDHPYRTFRKYSLDRIMNEMNFFYERGVREFVFFDDMFNVTSDRAIEISEGIIRRFPGIVWSFRGRADQITQEMIEKVKKAGCTQAMFGLEAAKDEDLKAIKKNITIEKFLNGIRLCKKNGLSTSANYIIGLPTHKSRKDVLDMLDFAIKSGTDYAQFNILLPYAGTEIYAEAVRQNIIPGDFWKNYILNPQPNAYIPVLEQHLSRKELSELLLLSFRKFYLRPSKILEKVLSVRSFSQFMMSLRGMFVVMGFGGFRRKKTGSLAT
ncbi:MAG: radical SAM protein [Candidatus Omnitrophota bacterium]